MAFFRRAADDSKLLDTHADIEVKHLSQGGDLPSTVPDVRLTVDTAIFVNRDTVLIDGWSDAPISLGEGARPLTAAGTRGGLLSSAPMLQKERPDAAAALNAPHQTHLGFTGCVSGLDLSRETLELFFRIGNDVVLQRKVLWDSTSADKTRLLFRGTRPVATDELRKQVQNHVLPVLESEIDAQTSPTSESVYRSGEPAHGVSVNLVIPVYGNYHYLRNQLLGLTRSVREDFIITLVCDDPRISRDLEQWLRAWNEVYDLPVELIVHDANSGFAQACNTGLNSNDAEFTAFANSDVLFSGTDWLDSSIEQLEAGAALAAPVLLYPDGSIQHAGMVIEPGPGEFRAFRLPRHLFAGLDPRVVGRKPREVEYLSGALLVARTETLRSIGGMPTWLGKGDFEDVALCELLRPHGPLVICASQRLTHIEAASYDRFGQSDVLFTLAKSLMWESHGRPTLMTAGQHE